MPPSHAAILLAIAPLDDLELQAWTERPDRYHLTPAAAPLPDHRAWVLGPADVRTPVGVLLVETPAGEVMVTSGNGPAVARLLAPIDDLSATALADTFLSLWQEPTRPARLVPGSATLAAGATGRQLCFTAAIPPRDPQQWTVDLSGSDLQVRVNP